MKDLRLAGAGPGEGRGSGREGETVEDLELEEVRVGKGQGSGFGGGLFTVRSKSGRSLRGPCCATQTGREGGPGGRGRA